MPKTTNDVNKGKTAFLKACQGKRMQGCTISLTQNRPIDSWRTITSANSKEIIFSYHSRLPLPDAKHLKYEVYPTGGMFLKLLDDDGKCVHMYALRRR